MKPNYTICTRQYLDISRPPAVQIKYKDSFVYSNEKHLHKPEQIDSVFKMVLFEITMLE